MQYGSIVTRRASVSVNARFQNMQCSATAVGLCVDPSPHRNIRPVPARTLPGDRESTREPSTYRAVSYTHLTLPTNREV